MEATFSISDPRAFARMVAEELDAIQNGDKLYFQDVRKRLGGISDDTLTRRIKERGVNSYPGEGGRKYIMRKDLPKLR